MTRRLFNPDAATDPVTLPDGTVVGKAQVLYEEGAVWFALWSGDATSWHAEFDVDEAMVVLTGELHFAPNDEEPVSVSAGDAVVFRSGECGQFTISNGFSAWVLVHATA